MMLCPTSCPYMPRTSAPVPGPQGPPGWAKAGLCSRAEPNLSQTCTGVQENLLFTACSGGLSPRVSYSACSANPEPLHGCVQQRGEERRGSPPHLHPATGCPHASSSRTSIPCGQRPPHQPFLNLLPLLSRGCWAIKADLSAESGNTNKKCQQR